MFYSRKALKSFSKACTSIDLSENILDCLCKHSLVLLHFLQTLPIINFASSNNVINSKVLLHFFLISHCRSIDFTDWDILIGVRTSNSLPLGNTAAPRPPTISTTISFSIVETIQNVDGTQEAVIGKVTTTRY